jgi:hypothetical protein
MEQTILGTILIGAAGLLLRPARPGYGTPSAALARRVTQDYGRPATPA